MIVGGLLGLLLKVIFVSIHGYLELIDVILLLHLHLNGLMFKEAADNGTQRIVHCLHNSFKLSPNGIEPFNYRILLYYIVRDLPYSSFQQSLHVFPHWGHFFIDSSFYDMNTF